MVQVQVRIGDSMTWRTLGDEGIDATGADGVFDNEAEAERFMSSLDDDSLDRELTDWWATVSEWRVVEAP